MDELTVEAKIENLGVITGFVDEHLEKLDCPIKAQTQIEVAIDEIFTNISSYAYGDTVGMATLRFSWDETAREVKITFADNGSAFDPLQHEEPDVTLPAEQREIGGLGIFLVRKTMDQVTYRRENDQNILTISKKI